MCGIGTTLVEALHPDRRAVGVEYEPHWAEHRPRQPRPRPRPPGAAGRGWSTGDARHLDRLLPPTAARAGRAGGDLPAVRALHPRPGHAPTAAACTSATTATAAPLDRGNLANIGHHRLLAGFTRILTPPPPYLRPGGHVVITVRPWREHAELIDLPTQITACGTARRTGPRRTLRRPARPRHRHRTGSSPAARSSNATSSANNAPAGLPLHLIAHEDVIILRKSQPLSPDEAVIVRKAAA